VEDGCSTKCNVGPSIAEFMNVSACVILIALLSDFKAFKTSQSKNLCEFESSKMEEFEKGILAYFDCVYNKFLLCRRKKSIAIYLEQF